MTGLLGIARFTFHPGGAEDFKRLSRDCVNIVSSRDRGTLRYDIFLNAGETEATVIEEYVDVDALIEHSANIGETLSAQILATGTVHGELLGELSDEFRAQLEGGPVQPFALFLSCDVTAAELPELRSTE